MSPSEVRTIAGNPHSIYNAHPSRREKYNESYDWHYVCDSGWAVLDIVFDREDKVIKTRILD